MAEEDTNLFVKFEDPVSFRKAILEASKDILVSLQNFENFKALKQERIDLTTELREQMNEMNSLLNDVKKNMPKTGAIKAKAKTIAKPVVVKTVARTMQPEKNELNSIEAQLADIESQLSDLG